MTTVRSLTALALTGTLLFTANTLAKKPENPGNSGKNMTPEHHSPAASRDAGHHNYFDDRRKSIIRDYYSGIRGSGNCPPGLAKKHNGCQPPGQAKKWQIGRPLPGDVVYYPLPYELLHHLGHTSEGQKLVRVGTDILLISVGTSLVLDAIDDLDDVF
jgi:hypothetical protein